MNSRKFTLSVIIITKNEEDRIRKCLDSLAGLYDELIVFDSGSTDKTVRIVREYTEKIFITDWPGYGKQKQRALSEATCKWVLSIDADEALTPGLKKEIIETLNKAPEVVAFLLPWAVTNFGKRLDFGNSARSVKRLFLRDQARFTDAIVHEKIQTKKGKTGRFKGRLTHYSIRNFEHYLMKNRKYAWLGSVKRFEAGKNGFGLPGAAFRACWVFFRTYILKRGFLDGSVGFLVACMYSQGAFNKYAGLWILRREKKLRNK